MIIAGMKTIAFTILILDFFLLRAGDKILNMNIQTVVYVNVIPRPLKKRINIPVVTDNPWNAIPVTIATGFQSLNESNIKYRMAPMTNPVKYDNL